MKTILIISFSVIRSDPRVMRQVRLLEHRYKVTVAGYGEAPDADIRFVSLDKPLVGFLQKAMWAAKLFWGAFEHYYWCLPEVIQSQDFLAGVEFDLVLANDVSSLPLALKLAGRAPVLIDAHEYSPKEFEDRWLWRVFFSRYYNYICSRYLPRSSGMLTVCSGIADEYKRNYGVMPKVVHNAPMDQELLPSFIDSARIRLVHHGLAMRSRHLEVMIDMMKYLDARFSLDLMLVEVDVSYMEELRSAAALDARVQFVEPVLMPEICRRINEYDIGVFLLPPVNFNYKYALPNKFFEFIQARLAVAIGPSPEMANLVNEYACGVVADSFDPKDLAAVLQRLDAEGIARLKHASHLAAKKLNYEVGGSVLLSEVQSLLQQ